jgi:hypothetical protein
MGRRVAGVERHGGGGGGENHVQVTMTEYMRVRIMCGETVWCGTGARQRDGTRDFTAEARLALMRVGTSTHKKQWGVGASAGERRGGFSRLEAGSRPYVGRVADSPHSYHHQRRTHRALSPCTESPFPPLLLPPPLSLPETQPKNTHL